MVFATTQTIWCKPGKPSSSLQNQGNTNHLTCRTILIPIHHAVTAKRVKKLPKTCPLDCLPWSWRVPWKTSSCNAATIEWDIRNNVPCLCKKGQRQSWPPTECQTSHQKRWDTLFKPNIRQKQLYTTMQNWKTKICYPGNQGIFMLISLIFLFSLLTLCVQILDFTWIIFFLPHAKGLFYIMISNFCRTRSYKIKQTNNIKMYTTDI